MRYSTVKLPVVLIVLWDYERWWQMAGFGAKTGELCCACALRSRSPFVLSHASLKFWCVYFCCFSFCCICFSFKILAYNQGLHVCRHNYSFSHGDMKVWMLSHWRIWRLANDLLMKPKGIIAGKPTDLGGKTAGNCNFHFTTTNSHRTKDKEPKVGRLFIYPLMKSIS